MYTIRLLVHALKVLITLFTKRVEAKTYVIIPFRTRRPLTPIKYWFSFVFEIWEGKRTSDAIAELRLRVLEERSLRKDLYTSLFIII